ncbi:MAG: four helix bundle protein [Calditrichaceae bacterium]|nr:four helix bundle protein [Calditrichaceae bacterium]MBN2707499.1 four helix bundle protein [Calditrichaceae bacterium]RQV95590.1 MAG: four helix bundle protein [Calditrichota bacterium]
MEFSHKKLDVYIVSLEYVKFVYSLVNGISSKHRYAKDQILRASQSIPLNIAEGNGKFKENDRNRYFAIARGSALECSAVQDVLLIGNAINKTDYDFGEKLLIRIVSMLTKMTRKSWEVKENSIEYCGYVDETDSDENKIQ